MKYIRYYISSKDGKSNCVIRSFCKIYNKEYDDVYNDLIKLAKENKCESYNDVKVFELYMKNNNTFPIEYGNNLKIKDLKLDDGEYLVFCYDKKDLYHMVAIIDNKIYDKDNKSLELYVIKLYKKR